MNKLQNTVYHIHNIDDKSSSYSKKDKIHPVSYILVTVIYILVVISFPKYDLWGLLGMIIYLVIIGILQDISIKSFLWQSWPVLILVSMVGLANPFVDRTVYLQTDFFPITFGLLSMITLMLKGVFSVSASYILITNIGMNKICYGLRCLHVPKELVTIIMLIYRYLIVLLKETDRMSLAYKLRSYGQRGIYWKVWGSFVGQLMLRSIDRAEVVYESMLLRGYDGEFIGDKLKTNHTGNRINSIIYAIGWCLVFLILRFFPVFQMVGTMIG